LCLEHHNPTPHLLNIRINRRGLLLVDVMKRWVLFLFPLLFLLLTGSLLDFWFPQLKVGGYRFLIILRNIFTCGGTLRVF
jgi:hypothetical protein